MYRRARDWDRAGSAGLSPVLVAGRGGGSGGMGFGVFGLRSEAAAQADGGVGAPSDRRGALDEADRSRRRHEAPCPTTARGVSWGQNWAPVVQPPPRRGHWSAY